MERTRVAIVGTGFAAAAHADALRRLPGVELVGVAGRTAERAREAAERLGAPQSWGGWEEALADDGVDAVHNCTPNHLHREVSAAALAAGKHLLAEKPLATSSAESAALAELAGAAGGRGLVTGVCFNYRHYPLVRHARELVARGALGPIHFVRGGYLQDWLLHASDWNWRLDPAVNGPSRAIADIGSHWADLVQHVTGDAIVSVLADLGTLHPVRLRSGDGAATFAGGGADGEPVPVESEDFGTVLLRFASGARGSVSVSQVSAGRKNRLYFEVDGAEAGFAWDQEEPNRAWIGRRDAENGELLRDPALLSPEAARLAHYPGGHQEGWPDALRNLVEDFYGAVAARRRGEAYDPSFATFDEAHRVVQLVEAVVASHAAQRWTPVAGAREVAA